MQHDIKFLACIPTGTWTSMKLYEVNGKLIIVDHHKYIEDYIDV